MHVAENKTELFHFLSKLFTTSTFENRQVLITDDCHVLCSKGVEYVVDASIGPCTHEEADTRMLVHAAHAGYSKVMIRTVDTDVVVIAVACWQHLNLEELWIMFGTG